MVDLFVMPPSQEELLARLSGRATDTPEVIALRMKNAMEEMQHWQRYTYVLLSATRDEDYDKLLSLIKSERMRVSRIRG
jgi:guanylate kinase